MKLATLKQISDDALISKYALLNKLEAKMPEYWPSSFPELLWIETYLANQSEHRICFVSMPANRACHINISYSI